MQLHFGLDCFRRDLCATIHFDAVTWRESGISLTLDPSALRDNAVASLSCSLSAVAWTLSAYRPAENSIFY